MLQVYVRVLLTNTVGMYWHTWLYLFTCRSVDGKVRRYDIRFGKLFCDTVARMLTCSPTVHAMYIPYCPAVTPPPFATYFQEKEGGGRNNEDLRFCLAVKPPPPPPLPRIHVLCSAVEDENSLDRHAVAVLKDGRVVGHVHVAKHSR